MNIMLWQSPTWETTVLCSPNMSRPTKFNAQTVIICRIISSLLQQETITEYTVYSSSSDLCGRSKLPHHNRFTALFPGPPGWAGARRELLDFMMQGKINKQNNKCGKTNLKTKPQICNMALINLLSTIIRTCTFTTYGTLDLDKVHYPYNFFSAMKVQSSSFHWINANVWSQTRHQITNLNLTSQETVRYWFLRFYVPLNTK